MVHVRFCYFLQELEVHFSGEFGKESCIDTNDAPFQEESKPIEEEILLPPDKELKEIFGIEVPSKDVGNALQLLEFCKVFGKVWFHVNILMFCLINCNYYCI